MPQKKIIFNLTQQLALIENFTIIQPIQHHLYKPHGDMKGKRSNVLNIVFVILCISV